MVLFKGRKRGMIHTMDIEWKHIRSIFFPRGFYEKYRYLGSIPWSEESDIFKAMEPLVIFMDHRAKPWWCPRWFLRLLHLFGNDNSIVRVRNFKLHRIYNRITRGYIIFDYKTKWEYYDLRISESGDDQCYELARAIEERFYDNGLRKELFDEIKKLDPDTKCHIGWDIESLKESLSNLR